MTDEPSHVHWNGCGSKKNHLGSSQSVWKRPQSWRVADSDHQIWGNVELDLFRLDFIFLFTLISISASTLTTIKFGKLVFLLAANQISTALKWHFSNSFLDTVWSGPSKHRFLCFGKTRPTYLAGKFDQKYDWVKNRPKSMSYQHTDLLNLQPSGLKRGGAPCHPPFDNTRVEKEWVMTAIRTG